MKGKKEEKDNAAKSSWSLGKIEEFFDKNVELAKREFNFLRAVSLITPEVEEAFRAAPIDVVLPKNDRQEDKALKELERERRHEANRACIRKFLEIGRELKKSDPESKLFKMSEELLDYLDRIESDLHSLSEYEWKKLDTGLRTYESLLRGEAEKRCKATSAEKPAEIKREEKAKEIHSVNIQNSNVILGDVHQAENLQIGNSAKIDKQPKAEAKNKEKHMLQRIYWLFKKIPHWIYALIIFLAALLAIFNYLGWLD